MAPTGNCTGGLTSFIVRTTGGTAPPPPRSEEPQGGPPDARQPNPPFRCRPGQKRSKRGKSVLCEATDVPCPKTALWNYAGGPARFCREHQLHGMLKVVRKTQCLHPGCTTHPSFGVPGTPISKRYCLKHKQDNMINLNNTRCVSENCTTHATYNWEGKGPHYCASHKEEGMINVVNPICKEPSCSTQARYSQEKGMRPEYCAKHKDRLQPTEGSQLYVKKSRCLEKGCDTTPSKNYPGSRPLYCSKHALPGMVYSNEKQVCKSVDCTTHASYNFEGHPLKFCATHRLPGMIDVKNPKCFSCTRVASFNVKGLHPRYCIDHRTPEMVYSKQPTCEVDGCFTLASQGFSQDRVPRFCNIHKIMGMINIRSTSCSLTDCYELARYNQPGKTAMYCRLHATGEMVNVHARKCNTVECQTTVANKNSKVYKGYCLGCFTRLFPNEPRSRNALVSEKIFVEAIQSRFPGTHFVLNRSIGPSNRRPDVFTKDFGSFCTILENDEHQHDLYDQEDEILRNQDLSRDVGHTPILLIRMNPDEYYTNEGARVPSCFKYDKKTRAHYLSYTDQYNARIDQVVDLIEMYRKSGELDNAAPGTVREHKLFYDGH